MKFFDTENASVDPIVGKITILLSLRAGLFKPRSKEEFDFFKPTVLLRISEINSSVNNNVPSDSLIEYCLYKLSAFKTVNKDQYFLGLIHKSIFLLYKNKYFAIV